jgi:hypothetical protein
VADRLPPALAWMYWASDGTDDARKKFWATRRRVAALKMAGFLFPHRRVRVMP